MIETFVPESGSVAARSRLNLRRGSPFRSAPLAATVAPATRLTITGIGRGEPVQGNDIWYRGEADIYFWSGGCMPFGRGTVADLPAAGAGPGPGPAVSRRADGSIRPLDDAGLRAAFGTFAYAEAAGGRIRIAPEWVEANIVRVDLPLLAETGHGQVDLHRKAAAAFTAVFAAVGEAGLGGLILTCAGTFVPRHKGWDPARGLSSHSWGIAIDLNAAWNGYGRTPAPRGSRGSLVDLVPIFEAHGFAWGGYFAPPYEDGMHFELARSDL